MQKKIFLSGYRAAGIVIILLLSVSCRHNHKAFILPEKQFISVLVDLHIAESIGVQYRRDMDLKYRVDSATLYGSVFEKHHITRAMFDSTLIYYGARPEKFQKIYNAVTAKLKRMEQDIIDTEKQIEIAGTETLYKNDTTYVFPKNGPDRIAIDVPISGPGIYTVSADVKLLDDDMSVDPRMSVYLYKSDTSAEGRKLNFQEIRFTNRTGENRNYEAVRRVIDSSYTNIRGYIANYSNTDSTFRRNMVVKNIIVTRRDINYGKAYPARVE
ncbi:MAG TPA: DUF4296 domain-containing protein [Bacteroidales bacterium]|nr:DUF4296 domain-containing protein [Bacteroidales bacterium]